MTNDHRGFWYVGVVMKHLHFIRSTLEKTQELAQALEAHGVKAADIHVVGKDHFKMYHAHLHEADLLETTDLRHAFKRGIKVGALVGIGLGLLIVTKIFPELHLGVGTVIGFTVFVSIFGAWVSSMVGVAVQSPLVEKFEKEIEKGHYLILVKVPEDRVNEVKSAFKLAA